MRRTTFDRMSAHDAGYLDRETAAQPLHYVMQLELAGRVSLDEVREHVAARLGRAPELLRMIRRPLLVGRAVWVDDPAFSVERQVVGWDEPLSDEAARERALSELALRRLRRDRPLWQLVVGSGPGEQTTLWLSVHHALMDGQLLSRVLAELFGWPAPAPVPCRPRRGPSRANLLVRVLVRRLVGRSRSGGGAKTQAKHYPTTLTGPVSAQRAVASARLPLADVRAARARLGVTVNDLFLAATTTALRDYLPEPANTVVALVPRNVRPADEPGAIGNKAWAMLVPLPTADADPARRLAAIVASTAAGKQAEQTSGTQGWAFDIALSNVRLGGELAVCGIPVAGHCAAVPLQGENRLVVLATSLGEQFTLSVTADAQAFPDAHRLADLTAESLLAAARTAAS